jgi:hypothetical protein
LRIESPFISNPVGVMQRPLEDAISVGSPICGCLRATGRGEVRMAERA